MQGDFDRTGLPIPEPKLPTYTELDATKVKPPPRFEVRAPAGARYTSVDQIIAKDLKRWLQKSIDIQWDYKNIVKRKGKLVRLK
jgi:hypothetical protein